MLTTRARVSIPCVNKLRSVNKIGPGRAQRSGLGIYRIFGENVERVAALSCALRAGAPRAAASACRQPFLPHRAMPDTAGDMHPFRGVAIGRVSGNEYGRALVEALQRQILPNMVLKTAPRLRNSSRRSGFRM